jgi:hypothetical protein
VDGEVCVAAHDHRLHFAHEKPLAADFGERAVLDAVALGANVDFLDRELREMAPYLLAHPTGLDESKITRACCNA